MCHTSVCWFVIFISKATYLSLGLLRYPGVFVPPDPQISTRSTSWFLSNMKSRIFNFERENERERLEKERLYLLHGGSTTLKVTVKCTRYSVINLKNNNVSKLLKHSCSPRKIISISALTVTPSRWLLPLKHAPKILWRHHSFIQLQMACEKAGLGFV